MSEFNPYAPPETPTLASRAPAPPSGELFRDGWCVVFAKGAVLPDRCLWCNTPADGYRLSRTLYWHAPVWYLVALLPGCVLGLLCMAGPSILAALVILLLSYVIVSLCVRQTARVAAPLCLQHRRRRRWAIGWGWVGALGAIGLMVAGIQLGSNAIGIPGLFLLPISLIASAIGAQVVVPERIDRQHVWLKAGPDFLASLPEWSTAGMRST